MIYPIHNYFLQQQEPNKSCLLFLRKIILEQNEFITEKLSYGMPTYYYKGKRFCYLWVHKKLNQPYIGIIDGNKIDHPDLVQEDRARMKIFLVDAGKDVEVKNVNGLLKRVLKMY
jgi:hypothetical protein